MHKLYGGGPTVKWEINQALEKAKVTKRFKVLPQSNLIEEELIYSNYSHSSYFQSELGNNLNFEDNNFVSISTSKKYRFEIIQKVKQEYEKFLLLKNWEEKEQVYNRISEIYD